MGNVPTETVSDSVKTDIKKISKMKTHSENL